MKKLKVVSKECLGIEGQGEVRTEEWTRAHDVVVVVS